MMAKKAGVSSYYRRLQAIMHQFHDETGIKDIDIEKALLWGEEKGLISPPQLDPRQKLKRDMAAALRDEMIVDENGESVRRVHAYRVNAGEKQLVLWGYIEDMNPQKWRASMSHRRRGYRAGILQCDRDNQYWNKHHNPGDQIEFDWNFNPDVQESRMPTEYPDAPPEGDG